MLKLTSIYIYMVKITQIVPRSKHTPSRL